MPNTVPNSPSIGATFAYLRNRLVRNIIEVGAIVEDLFERFRPRENS
jgi:hypothetical protein